MTPRRVLGQGFILPRKYHALIFTENSVIPQQTEYVKTNNNIVGYHLVSRLVLSTPSDV